MDLQWVVWLLVLACPLMMLFHGRGMMHGQGTATGQEGEKGGHCGPAGAKPPSREERLAELQARLAALQAQQEKLRAELTQLAAEVKAPVETQREPEALSSAGPRGQGSAS